MSDLTVRDLYALMVHEYKGRDPIGFGFPTFPLGTWWVMDLASYRAIRAACLAAGAIYPADEQDPDSWVPKPEDRLFGLPIEVRVDGGEPHLVSG